ncbi:hypothetical protein EYZ11_007710 [Aspergillus tanneri]|uniref:Major facilitator superfamily (MFS) profile domain-containing protein n=1 Tax=Aspergillus tanneri TaxID=1220188 RepID=A0A4S3JEJ7_9EURO|nr:uncharacterized protein ATNIH1004_007711 [Aspergillus tanneri]KAA8646284.1 hypothetical protein ATNIH1004_007711 [Aspergillus tanneri]THC92808.1 hypothetical protein EYZ11_007710 [Aspergillus tanneri]
MLQSPSTHDLEKFPMSGCSSLNSLATHVASEQCQGSPPGSSCTLVPIQSQVSGHEVPPTDDHYEEADAKQYDQFSPARKIVILCILSYGTFLAPISSTAMMAAVPEMASTYQTTPEIINASTALYLVFMGISALFWGPLSQICGRRPALIASSVLFFAFTIGTTLAPNLPAYFIFRIVTAFQGMAFLVVGSSAVGDIYEPRTRATALGWVVSGSLIGPALGPFLGGVIVTYRPWRTIFWLISAMSGFAALIIIVFLPETIPSKANRDFTRQSIPRQAKLLCCRISPLRVFTLIFRYPNLFWTGLAGGALVWNQYALLTPIRPVLNPRFHLTSPIQAGLFYLAPSAGFLAGSFVGGRWADYIVRKYITRRKGVRIPEDRLRSCLPYICIFAPCSVLVYGWTLDQAVGGIPVPVIAMFLQGVFQLMCLPSLNTYCLDVMHFKGRSAEVIAGSYTIRYFFAALGTGVSLPAIQTLGVGWFNTISALFLLLSGVMVWVTAVFGPRWRESVDHKYEEKAARRKGLA